MMKPIYKYLIILFSLNIYCNYAQELNSRIQVNYQQIQGVDRQKFLNMKTAIFEFMNNTRWTNDVFYPEERIECNITLNLNKQIGLNEYRGSLNVKSSRTIFNSSYNSPILNIVDNNLNFEYNENEVLEFNKHNHTSNLISILAYYAYIIIGMDYDTFSIEGGQEFFINAQKVLNNAVGDQKAIGWKPYESLFNRHWLIENLLHNDFKNLRNANYIYHLNGLDKLSDQKESARDEIISSLYSVKKSFDKKQGSYLLKVFFDAKSDEIVNIFSDGFISNKNEVVDLLKQMDPSNISKWDRILLESNRK